MKVYVIKFKEEVVSVYLSEDEATSSYSFRNNETETKGLMSVASATLTFD